MNYRLFSSKDAKIRDLRAGDVVRRVREIQCPIYVTSYLTVVSIEPGSSPGHTRVQFDGGLTAEYPSDEALGLFQED